MRYIIFINLIIFSHLLMAQSFIVPSAKQQQSILINGGTIHIGDQSVIENGAIGFKDGKIDFVGPATGTIPQYDTIIDATGKHIYPGLIAPNNQLGLVEIGAVRATNDKDEIGELKPHIRSIIAYNTDSDVIATVRNMGVLLSEVTPVGGAISGTSSIVQLDAWNWEDAAYKTDIGIHLNWPRKFKSSGWWAEPGLIKKVETYQDKLTTLKVYFENAKAYNQGQPKEKNLRMESLKGLFDGSKKLFIHINHASSIIEAVELGKSLGIEVVLVGAYDSYLVLDYLKQNNISVIINSTQSLPLREDDDIDLPYKLPKLLSDAGINFAFGHEGFWQLRNFAFQAGQACAYGLDQEAAIEAMTLNTAKIFNIDHKTGSLMKGKDANIVVSKGDILDMSQSEVTEAFIQGRSIDLNNKQIQLYKKFSKKLNR